MANAIGRINHCIICGAEWSTWEWNKWHIYECHTRPDMANLVESIEAVRVARLLSTVRIGHCDLSYKE